MRFVFAIITFVLAAVLVGSGIAARTVFAGPSSITAATSEVATAPVTVIDGAALSAHPFNQRVEISGSPTIFAAYGRTADVLAWIGPSSYTRITYDRKAASLQSTTTEGEPTVPNPAGSDLWLQEFTGQSSLGLTLDVPRDYSIVLVSDGTAPAPSTVSVTWPLNNSVPWALPAIIAGAALLLVGLLLLLWALTHLRRTRGPRRTQAKQPKMPKLPRQPRYRPARQKAIDPAKGRRAIRRSVAVVPVITIGALLLTGCTAPLEATPTPTATAAAIDPDLPVPGVSESQVKRIVAQIADVAAQADSKLDADLVATRFAGPALDLRLANYKIRKANSKLAAVQEIPAGGNVEVVLPQQTVQGAWPRTVMAVVTDPSDAEVPPLALFLVQDDPRSNYRIHYSITLTLAAGQTLPDVAPAAVGAARLGEDSPLLALPPEQLAVAYGDILLNDSKSQYYDLFDAQGDTLREQVGLKAKQATKKKLPKTAKITFKNAAGSGQVIPLATNDSGALVAVQLVETETVKPVKTGAVVSSKGAVKALSGKSTSRKGLAASYGDELLFYVPSATVGGKIVLLGFSQGLISARETK